MKVILGMSGGVDSSVAAYLLKKEGYEVIGVTLKFLDDLDDTDAKRVCNILNIEHYTIDYTKEFKEIVIDSFIENYKRGITPNPCVICNKKAKMNFLYQIMLDFKCDYFATGHYVKHINNRISRGNDIKKDQSYFLSCVDDNILKYALFPLGNYTKDEVRNIAQQINLDNANKKDSYDVCFIRNGFKEFINDNIKSNPGKIINVETNEVLGTHEGLQNYTIGQRKNVGLSGNDKRHYVCGKDNENNILYVAFGDDSKYLISNEAIIENVNYISDKHPTFATAKFRYKSEDVPVSIEYLENNIIKLKYEGFKSVTPGQTCTIYLGEQCLMGGTIKQVLKDGKALWYLK